MNTADIQRQIENLIRLAEISEVDFHDPENPVCRCKIGKIDTDWLSLATVRAGSVREWNPPSEGEQAVILSPSGDLSQGIIIAVLYSSRFPAPDTAAHKPKRTYPDGAVIEYDYEAHQLTALLPDGATFELKSDGGLKITGDIDLDGGIKTTKDVVVKGVSFLGHVHSGVLPGPANTAIPVGATP